MSDTQSSENNEQQQQKAVEMTTPQSSIPTQSQNKKSSKLIFICLAVIFGAYICFNVYKQLKSSNTENVKIENKETGVKNTTDVFGSIDALRTKNDVEYVDNNPPVTSNNEPVQTIAEPAPIIKGSPSIIISSSSSRASQTQQTASNNDQSQNTYSLDSTLLDRNYERGDGNLKKQINQYEAVPYGKASAVFSSLNPSLSISKGSFIRCSLRTKIISTVGGEVTCTISNDVFSTDGKVVLIEKGSQVFGHFRTGGELNLSDARMFIIWNEIRTPNNITIQINSNATGALGETGVGGWVDTHFWERFGSAIMVSLVTDLSSAVTSQAAKKDTNTYNFSNTQSATSETVSSILKETVNIPPTLYKNQGDIVGIMFSRDLDFSEVYDLRVKR